VEPCEVRWYTFSWTDVFRLPTPEEVRRAEVEVFLYREAEVLRYWGEREPQVLGLFPWSWVPGWEERRVARCRLQDWYGIFRDLQFFFCVHESPGGASSVHILAVQEDGEDYPVTRRDELQQRYEVVLTLLEAERGPDASGSGP